ncbi:POTRA domain-containing protein [Synechococcus sp. PCC 7336]|uniref:POTRA domain-containing protein n=1 Tax=Synechococcus sp. PCC 7336 TaxID=195250 RepID=UPI001D0D25B6|nr:POTRA domain-containing protein [Synechococcus sp. PCC 7336]
MAAGVDCICPRALWAETVSDCRDSISACLQAQSPAPDLQAESPAFVSASDLLGPVSITVERFEFEGNTAFSDRELSEILADLLGRSLSFVELLEAEKLIERVYARAGYLNSGAVIVANQTLSPTNAVVAVRIVEGELEAIEVTGNRRLRTGYIRSRLELGTAGALNQDRVLEALQLLQLDPLIESVSAELSAGTRPESSVLSVRIEEAKVRRGSWRLGWRCRVRLARRKFWGWSFRCRRGRRRMGGRGWRLCACLRSGRSGVRGMCLRRFRS